MAPASATLVVLMLAGCLFLWVAAPLGWLWIGSQLQQQVSLGTALMVAMTGFVATVLVVIPALSWLNRWHIELRGARRLPAPRHSVLEVLLVVSAFTALIAFCIWFFGFSGASPAPLNVSY